MCSTIAQAVRPSVDFDAAKMPLTAMPALGQPVLYTNYKGRQNVGFVVGNDDFTNELALFVVSPSGTQYTRTSVPWIGSAKQLTDVLPQLSDFEDIAEVLRPDARYSSGYRVVEPARTAQEQLDEALAAHLPVPFLVTGFWDYVG